MTTSAATSVSEFGAVGSTRFVLAETSSPWELDIDTIVVSVGRGVGMLGGALRQAYPDAAWNAIEYDSIDAGHPQLFELAPGLRALLVNPRESSGEGADLSHALLRSATWQAFRVAVEAGARSLGLSLLTAGMLNAPSAEVAETLVGAAIDYASTPEEPQLARIVFFCRTDEDAQIIADEMARSLPATSPRPIGGLNSDRVDPNAGIPLSRDRLGVAPYVSMLATVIADRETPLPLLVGVFGAWARARAISWPCCATGSRGWPASAADTAPT